MPRNQFVAVGSELSRRQILKAAGAAAAFAAAGSPGRLFAQEKLKVAAIYTVPFEQQWVSRIHKAANAAKERGDIEYVATENVSNTDYERVMREYAEAGNKLIVGEVFGVEDAARTVAADYPETAFLMGSSFKPDDKNPNFSVFDNYIQDASYLTGIIAGAMTKTKNIGMVGGFPIPEVNRLMNAFMAGVKETRPTRNSRSRSSARGSIRPRPRRPPSPRSTAARTCFTPSASAFPMRPRKRAYWPSAMSSTRRPIIPKQSLLPRSGISSRRWTRLSQRSRRALSRPPITVSIPS